MDSIVLAKGKKIGTVVMSSDGDAVVLQGPTQTDHHAVQSL